MLREGEVRIPSGCAVSAILNVKGRCINGEAITQSIACMRERSNGLGGGFAAYGIYPEFKDHYAFHLLCETEQGRLDAEELLRQNFLIDRSEPIPTRKVIGIENPPAVWRYFARVRPEKAVGCSSTAEGNLVTSVVMKINKHCDRAYVASSGKNMGVFKGVGFPEDIAAFYRLEEYEGYLWTAHGRFPTNTPGWWGGAHPLGLLDWSVVHNGEISSYGANKRYLEMFRYRLELQTDTEVVAYLFDLLHRRHDLPLELVCRVLAAPFWKDIDRMPEPQRRLYTALRQVYGSALLNGPFSIIVAHGKGLIGLNDRIKLRPLVYARKGDFVLMGSEESALRRIFGEPDEVRAVWGGEPVIVELEGGSAQ
ncbi:MAG: glutamine amidotransferase family protein [Peptococcaceae bacterium]|nr:glutamine amidotransferase family protein [Peptococcaceae bacterium]